MRRCITLVVAMAALTPVLAGGAEAGKWCGYAARAKSVIECGYSGASECENVVGKGGMCFIDPDYAANSGRGTPAIGQLALGTTVGG